MSKKKPISDEKMYDILSKNGFDCRITEEIYCNPYDHSKFNCKAFHLKETPIPGNRFYCQIKLKEVYDDIIIDKKLKAILE
jgi:hypothetical protein